MNGMMSDKRFGSLTLYTCVLCVVQPSDPTSPLQQLNFVGSGAMPLDFLGKIRLPQ